MADTRMEMAERLIEAAGELTVQPLSPIPTRVHNALTGAYYTLKLCGLKPKTLIKVQIMGEQYTDNGNVLCGEAVLGGREMSISLFPLALKRCENLENTAAHEMLHLLGYDHKTLEDMDEFYALMSKCGYEETY